MRKAILAALLAVALNSNNAPAQPQKPPVRFAMVGLVHDHALGFIRQLHDCRDVQLVGIVETNHDLAARYAKQFNLDKRLFHDSLDELLSTTNAQAAAIFSSTFDHARIVAQCAARHLTVMMEKPLAVDMEQARAIADAANKSGIQVIVNYETTWYAANQAAYTMVHNQHAIGDLRKIVFHDGHRGPKEIGCSPEFLEWLTDPVLGGGGALTDFGCYGAGLITWFMDGQRPLSVFAVTQQIKPAEYPKVDDEATIVLTYPSAQGIIQASWNWPFDRKDMELYGKSGYVMVPQKDVLRVRKAGAEESRLDLPSPLVAGPLSDPASYLAAVVRGELRPSGPSSLEVNLIATEILDAARRSSECGQRIVLGQSREGK